MVQSAARPGLATCCVSLMRTRARRIKRLSRIDEALQPTGTPHLTLVAAGEAKQGTKRAAASGEPSFQLLGPVLDKLAANAMWWC